MPMHLMGGGYQPRPGMAPGFGQLQQPAAPRTREVTHLQHLDWRRQLAGQSALLHGVAAYGLMFWGPCCSCQTVCRRLINCAQTCLGNLSEKVLYAILRAFEAHAAADLPRGRGTRRGSGQVEEARHLEGELSHISMPSESLPQASAKPLVLKCLVSDVNAQFT